VEDADDSALSYAEIKALAAGDPRIKEKMDLDVQVERLNTLRDGHRRQQHRLQDEVGQYPARKERLQEKIAGMQTDAATSMAAQTQIEDWSITIDGTVYTERTEAGKVIMDYIDAYNLYTEGRKVDLFSDKTQILEHPKPQPLDIRFQGFSVEIDMDIKPEAVIQGALRYRIELGGDAVGNLIRLENGIHGIPGKLREQEDKLAMLERDSDAARAELEKPFPFEEELRDKSARLAELSAALNLDLTDGAYDAIDDGEESLDETISLEPSERAAAMAR
jgi:FlaG/FlaF family flagellin (archaellin)